MRRGRSMLEPKIGISRTVISRRGAIRLGLGGASLISLVALAGCGRSGPAYSASSSDVAATVGMTTTLNFDPEEVTVQVGDTVEWRNKSLFTHTVTADKSLAKQPGKVRLPTGADPFNSGDIAPGEVFRRQFQVAGRYDYFCIPHEGRNMRVSVIVM